MFIHFMFKHVLPLFCLKYICHTTKFKVSAAVHFLPIQLLVLPGCLSSVLRGGSSLFTQIGVYVMFIHISYK